MVTQVQSSRSWSLLEKVQKHPEVVEISANIDRYEADLRQVDKLVAMDREARFSAAGPLYAECHGEAVETIKGHAMIVGIAGLALGAAASVAAQMIPGVPPQVSGLIALGTILMTFVPAVATRVSPMAAYAAAAKKWILPPKIDGLMLEDLARRKDMSETLLAGARVAKETVSRRVLDELEKATPVAPVAGSSLEVEEEQVVVNGISIPRRRG